MYKYPGPLFNTYMTTNANNEELETITIVTTSAGVTARCTCGWNAGRIGSKVVHARAAEHAHTH